MRRALVRKINHLGLTDLLDPLEYRRVLFVNNVTLASILVSFAVTILVIFEGLYPQFLVTSLGCVLFTIVLYLNHTKNYLAARTFFLLLSVNILVFASFVAFSQGRFNETENILIGFMAVCYLLYDGHLRHLGYILIYLVLIFLKFVKQYYLEAPYDLDFYLTIQNISILCLLLFLFADAFRVSLMKAFVRLKDKDELLYSMIDNVPLYIALVDNELRYRMVNFNYEKTFYMKREEIIGSRVEDVLPENILKTHLPMIKSAINGESPEFLEHTVLPDGSSFFAGGKYVPVRSDNGEIVGTTVFVNDVTKLETARNKLKNANATKDRLFSIIAHDIRGPLDLFEGLLNVSSDGTISREDFLIHQKKVGDKVSSLRDTVNTLLDWARTQLDGINANPSAVNVCNVIKTNTDLYGELISRKKINLKVDVPEEMEAWIDENHFKISIRNLIHNALKFTPNGGEISTSAEKCEDAISMTIKDTGIGMDPEKINSIMNKELQDSKGGTDGEMGTGLGLSLSLGLLEKNNCEVSIQSEPNSGTEINIKIPLKSHDN
ncbi:PAS domain S-box-containing protein [Ekhidna lutea]|uniref:histidine kinase n=1 Tax=Ekhidna lutea TaxID=447679 RepID=A0A239J286_EKHLU|nr:PAS domain-containing sensor histidine kinase [Ekhidna lutea]SNS99885.1 PAS domain S-box-containing protein [Ekhidna lutea]